jgi:hypothetical protein
VLKKGKGGNNVTSTLQEKKSELRTLELGDTVICSNGNQYEFIRMKRDKFIGKRNGVNYDIPAAMFESVKHKAAKETFDTSSLKEGDLFYILNSKQQPILFSFKYAISSTRIMAINPVTSTSMRIDNDLVKGNVRDLTNERS